MNLIFVDESVAISRMPYQDAIHNLSQQFKAAVVLAERHEMEYNIESWEKYNVDVLWAPTQDYTAPQLLQIYHIVKWIKNHVEKGKKVLVHCMGGKGRSGTIAVAYTIYTKHVSFNDALRLVRTVRRGAVETWEQGKRLKTFETTLRALPEPGLAKIVKVAEKYNYGKGINHASKVTELSLTLWEHLRQKVKPLQYYSKVLTAAAILHDIGVFASDFNYHEHTLKLIKENKNMICQVFSKYEYEATAWAAYYHQIKAGDPRTKINLKSSIKDAVVWSAAILRLADALDYDLNQLIEAIDLDFQVNKLIVHIYCNVSCKHEIDRALEKSNLLRDLVKREIVFKEIHTTSFL
ncbi:MAG: dual specificity protein phosphatase family protein [Candidatus Baldrarchaeia archaeon]